MNTHWLVVSLISAVLAQSAVAANSSDVVPLPRKLSAIQLDVHHALRAEAVSRRRGANVPQILRLVDLYREMAGHPQRNESMVLRQLGLRVRSRLKTVSDRIERQIAQRDSRSQSSKRLPAISRPETTALAQQFGPAGPGQGAPPVPAAVPPAAAAGIDYGPELVDVIQQTISPETWDINGGLGAVVYFTPRRAIVVRAPATVHHQVADLLGQLRAAP